jgi:hypothetical protein
VMETLGYETMLAKEKKDACPVALPMLT